MYRGLKVYRNVKLVFGFFKATPSNCGDTLRALTTKSIGKLIDGQGNDLGYGNNVKDITMDNPQPSPEIIKYGCSSQTKCWSG